MIRPSRLSKARTEKKYNREFSIHCFRISWSNREKLNVVVIFLNKILIVEQLVNYCNTERIASPFFTILLYNISESGFPTLLSFVTLCIPVPCCEPLALLLPPEAVRKKINTIANNPRSVTGEFKDSFLFSQQCLRVRGRIFEELIAVVMIDFFSEQV